MANNTLLASDNFASGSLAAGWAVLNGATQKSQIVSAPPNVAQPQVLSETDGQVWTGLVWPNDHISEITVNALTSELGTILNVPVRWQQSTVSGYRVAITNATATLSRYDSGVATTLASASSLTFAAGDVWTIEAAGAFIIVSQNAAQILFAADATYQNGYPGFYASSTVAIAHVRVASWRGYSVVQQDGVWTTQGIALAPLAGDLTAGKTGVATPCVIYEGNAQILSGNVYKMWYCSGQPSGSGNGDISYAESNDGMHWTRYASNPVLAGYLAPVVIKVAGTYYLYAQPNTGPATANWAAYTSANGLSWTLQNANVIGIGTTGAWDHTAFWQFCPVAVMAGTWYALYSAGGGSPYFNLGLATSANGLTGWTKYGSNPVVMNFAIAGNPFYSPDGGLTWYVWGGYTNLGMGGPKPTLDPLQCARYKATNNFTTWVKNAQSIHSNQMYENVNTTLGGSYITAIQSQGSQTFAWSNVGPDGSTPPNYQIALETISTSIVNLIAFPEDAVAQLATDNFARAPGSLGPNWSTPGSWSPLQIISGNLVEASGQNLNCFMAYTGAAFSANQYSEVTLQVLSFAGSLITPTVRNNVGTGAVYYANIEGPLGSAFASCQILGNNGSINVFFSPKIQITANVGDVFRLSVATSSDGFPTLTLYQNGFLILQAQDTAATPVSVSGSPGMYIFSSSATLTTAQASLWAGGNANVFPNYPPSGGGGGGDLGPSYDFRIRI